MNAMAEWLRAQLDREERDAALIPGGGYQPARWFAHRVPGGEWAEIRQHDLPVGADPDEQPEVYTAGLMVWGRNEDEHVTRWCPARAVAEVRAKRAVVDLWEAVGASPDIPPVAWVVLRDAVQALMVVYADQPGYQDEWRP